MYFCSDIELMAWEPALFFQNAFAHQALLKDAPATLTGTTLEMASPVLTDVLPGMAAQVTTADDSLTQLLEVAAVTDPSHATVSSLRGRADEPPILPLTGGSVKVTLITFRPQIAAVGDTLLAQLGITSDRDSAPAPASNTLTGFRLACIFGTLLALYRILSDREDATPLTQTKRTFYENLFHQTRRTLTATVDTDNDTAPETQLRAAVPILERI